MLQYAEFLRLAIDKDQYRNMMPSLGDLLSPDKYALEPEVAFLLYRPILSRVPFPDPPASKESEDGEIPDGGEAPMEVERGGLVTMHSHLLHMSMPQMHSDMLSWQRPYTAPIPAGNIHVCIDLCIYSSAHCSMLSSTSTRSFS